MPSSFAWVDFSEADRRRTQDVLDLLNERDTRDELGLGVVRDALADLLFPGTSTLHTRARYFLFIPWVYGRLADRRVSGADVARRARRAELDLVDPLKDNEDHEGIIGATAGDRLKRLPSSMYWAGLGAWRVRHFPGSQAQYHRLFQRVHSAAGSSDDDGTAGSSADRSPWDPGLPHAPDDFPSKVSFALLGPEAAYLRDRIQGLGRSLLAQLVRPKTVIEVTDYPWQRSDCESWSDELRSQLEHARNFSECMHGAALLYNRMLAEELKNDELIEQYGAWLSEWVGVMRACRAAHVAWRRDAFWALVTGRGVHVSITTRNFINGWLDLALADDPARLRELASARELLRRRERHLKRSRARLGNPSALARWGGAAGAGQLDYRWGRVQTITTDILRGLEAGE